MSKDVLMETNVSILIPKFISPTGKYLISECLKNKKLYGVFEEYYKKQDYLVNTFDIAISCDKIDFDNSTAHIYIENTPQGRLLNCLIGEDRVKFILNTVDPAIIIRGV